MFLMFWGSVGLWINGLVTLAETVQGGELDALVSLLREKVYTFGFFQALADCFVTRDAGIATAHGVGGGGVGAEELLSHAACKRSTRIQTPKPLPCPARLQRDRLSACSCSVVKGRKSSRCRVALFGERPFSGVSPIEQKNALLEFQKCGSFGVGVIQAASLFLWCLLQKQPFRLYSNSEGNWVLCPPCLLIPELCLIRYWRVSENYAEIRHSFHTPIISHSQQDCTS